VIKTVLHKGFSVLMAFLVWFSTVSFTIEKHFCGDVLVDVALFTQIDKCAMEAQEVLLKKSCCKDEVDVFMGQKELKFSSFDDLEFSHQQFITAFSYAFINLFEGLEQHVIPHKDYGPPLLVTNIQVLDQVFII